MTVRSDLCQSSSETTLLFFPRDGSILTHFFQDLFLSAGLDEANNTILSLYDRRDKSEVSRRDKSEVNVHIKEWKGPVLSLNVIDLGILQPSVPGTQ